MRKLTNGEWIYLNGYVSGKKVKLDALVEYVRVSYWGNGGRTPGTMDTILTGGKI
jgi:hypothetical protein